jgi:hypothetical protein
MVLSLEMARADDCRGPLPTDFITEHQGLLEQADALGDRYGLRPISMIEALRLQEAATA